MYAFCIMFSDVHDYVDEHREHGLTYRDVYIGSPALADDLTLLSCTKHGLDIMMKKVDLYSKIWKLSFSSTKTKCMVFGESKMRNNVNKVSRQFILGDSIIEEVDHYVHVGIELCSYMSSKHRITNMCKRGTQILAGLTAIGVKTNNVIPTISLSLWRKIGITSMLHGSETWWNLTKSDIYVLEKTQCSILKAIQNFSLRTHNAIVRSVIGQQSIQCYVEQYQLRFFSQLTGLGPNYLAFNVFFNRLFDWVFCHSKQTGYIPSVYNVFVKYGLQDYFYNYINGVGLPEKRCWKSLIKGNVKVYEEQQIIDILHNKHDVPRYLRIYKGEIHLFYAIMKRHKMYKAKLLSMIKLITIPINYEVKTCVSCGQIYTDIVDHCIAECNVDMQTRNDLWDIILDVLDVRSGVELFNKQDSDIIDILLGKAWQNLSDRAELELFYTSISTVIINFIPNICKNLPWYRM